ncbi:MAG: hypothetical protein JWM47_2933 [Acidimicrobiales bacterium]|nr:hypothetical protein [Acidimicrobiales bacterium]
MFIQTIQGRVDDADRFTSEAERWPRDLKGGAAGYLGCTWGVSPDGTAFLAARFESDQAAKANSERPEQGEWWSAIEPAFEDVAFHDSTEIDTMMGGGSDQAGFVQVIQGRVKDEAEARAMMQGAQAMLSQARPDILGGVMIWHGDGGGFTQIMYFRSQEAARAGEQGEMDPEVGAQYEQMMAAEPTFIDLTEPRFD